MGRLARRGSMPIRPDGGCRRPRSTVCHPTSTTGSSTSSRRFNPHVLVHIGVWEPDARASPNVARHLTDQAATSIIGAAAECPALENVIVRSGIEIYGRGRGALTRPDETAEVRPTSDWGRTLAEIEHIASRVANRIGVSIGAVRLAPVLGPHVPSPLGRMLRMPVVPFSLLADPPFAVIQDRDAAHALVAAARGEPLTAGERRGERGDHLPAGDPPRQAGCRSR